MHVEDPSSTEYCPNEQFVQKDEAIWENCPALHFKHADDAFKDENVPALQSTHPVDPDNPAADPGRHSKQTVAPC